MSIRQIELFRDSTHTPWGFRLVGGKDLKQALHVQKVSLCSPSHGELEAGDVLLVVQGHNATELTHAHAQDIMKRAGGSLKMDVRRCGQTSNQSSNFRPQSWHQGQHQGQGAYMMHRLNDTLIGAISNKHTRPLASNRARLNLTDWMLHNDVPSFNTPIFHPPPPPPRPRNEMGTCFVLPQFSSNGSLGFKNNYASNEKLNQYILQSPSHSEPPANDLKSHWKTNDYDSAEPIPFRNKPNHFKASTVGTDSHVPFHINASNKQYNSPMSLYGKDTAFQQPMPTYQTFKNEHKELKAQDESQDEVLYVHKVHP